MRIIRNVLSKLIIVDDVDRVPFQKDKVRSCYKDEIGMRVRGYE